MALIFQDAEKARDAIMASQKEEIAALYEKWADEIGAKAKHFSHQSTASSVVSERQMKELQKMLKTTGQEVSNEVHSKIKQNMYMIADAVVADNVKWLKDFGFSTDGLNAAFSTVPDMIIRNLVTGQIYDSGWSLSKRIWGDNETTMKDAYTIMAKGMAENKPIYEIAKELEQYVRPSAAKSWNPVLAMKNTKTGKIEHKRIYKKQVDYNAQRLARTLAQHSYQQSFLATTQKNPFITEYIWRSNGSRVCELCKARDGAHFKKDELPMDHPNGMCVMEPVVVKDMVEQLANWFNSPDGTYPEIDEFAGNFGYETKKVGTTKDFIDKYGMSTKSPNAWYNSLTQIQKAEAKALKDASGLTWNEWYEANIKSTGDPNLDFTKKWGSSDKAPSTWFNSLSAQQKAEAKALKEKTGLTWNQWYEKYVYSGNATAAKTSATQQVQQTVKVFNKAQEKYLSPYGFSPTNMPKDFSDWSHKISYEQAGEILKSMGTSWSDPHPYQQLMKYYESSLKPSWLMSKDVTATEAASAAAAKTVVNKAAKTVVSQSSKVPAYTTWIDKIKKQTDEYMLAKEKEWMKIIGESGRQGIHMYTGSSYTPMNGYLRNLQKGLSEADAIKESGISRSQLKSIKDAIEGLNRIKIDEDLVFRRGSSRGDIAGAFMQGDYRENSALLRSKTAKELNDMFVGAVGTYGSFTSTSSIWHKGFDGDLETIFYAPKGTSASSIMSISKFGTGEGETLLNVNTVVRCVKIEESDGHMGSSIRAFFEIITK